MDEAKLEEAADRLWTARATGVATAPVRDVIGEDDLDAAYAVQEVNTARSLAEGRRLVGRKIGLTSRAVQAQLKVDQPDYGMLFADMDVPDGERIALSSCQQPKVEAEIAFVVAEVLDQEDLTLPELLDGLDYALPAIEVVGSRVADWDIGITDTIADNASSGVYVLGQTPVAIGDFDPRLCGMVMFRGGEPVSVGAGAACLGSPYNATLWLARTMARVGRPLGPGDLVLSGALGPLVTVQPGDVFEARIEGVGSVRAAFGEE